jgi:hypothetical protein
MAVQNGGYSRTGAGHQPRSRGVISPRAGRPPCRISPSASGLDTALFPAIMCRLLADPADTCPFRAARVSEYTSARIPAGPAPGGARACLRGLVLDRLVEVIELGSVGPPGKLVASAQEGAAGFAGRT